MNSESIDLGLITPVCVDTVTSFIPVLSSIAANDVARWPEGRTEDGSLQLSLEPLYHPAVQALMHSFNENHFVQPFDWVHWQSTADTFHRDPNLLAQASLETCIELITLHVRKDRFCGGHFGAMVRSGHITAILRRLSELRASLQAPC